MFPGSGAHGRQARCFPRIRGDVPDPAHVRSRVLQFSPHTRGCSYSWVFVTLILLVFPAYAGMFLLDLEGGK